MVVAPTHAGACSSCCQQRFTATSAPVAVLTLCSRQRHAGISCGSSAAVPARRRHLVVPHSVDPVLTIAGTDPALLQDLIVGGAVTAAVGAAIVGGLKKDPQPCDLCLGTGGIQCFACEGSGDAARSDGADAARPPKRDLIGRTRNARACRVCGGTGLVLCSKCKGSGYQTTF